jgi:ankyrin repeat protein
MDGMVFRELWLAARNCSPSDLKKLLVKKAFVGYVDKIVTPLLIEVCNSQYLSLCMSPMKNNNFYEGQHDIKRAKCIFILVKYGANVNVKNSYGNTPLHTCCTSYYSLNTAKALLENGANVTLRNNKGKTPLELAMQNKGKNIGYDKLIELLQVYFEEKFLKESIGSNMEDEDQESKLIL